MRLSDRHKFVFIANPRCASTSIRRLLDDFSDLKSIDGTPGHWLYDHATAAIVRRDMAASGRKPDEYTFFTTIRNPWDRVRSIYRYGLKNERSAWHVGAAESKSVDAFVRVPDILERLRYCSFDSMCRHPNGRLAVDRIFRFEALALELPQFLKDLLGTSVALPTTNSTEPNDVASAPLKTETIDLISEVFASDVEMGDYRYEDPAG